MMKQSAVFRQELEAISPDLAMAEDLPKISIKVVNRPELVVEPWSFLERFATDPFSNYAWVKAWYDAHENAPNCSPVIILGTDKNHRPLFLLPLFLQKSGPFNVLLRPGRTHSACSSGLFSQSCRQMINAGNGRQFWKSVFSAVPRADAIYIDGVRDAEIAQNNPLGYLPHINSDNPSFEMLLTGDWERFCKSKLNRKARSNLRRCEKRLSELGELRFRIVETKEDRLAYLHVLLAQKAEQFRAHRTINPYETQNIISFYQKLVSSEINGGAQSPLITTLVLDDKPVAVILGMTQETEFHGLIMSMTVGPLARFSPGRLLLHRTLRHLSETGIRKIDFGVGGASYKEEWIDREIIRHHVLAALSIKGRLLVFGIRWMAAFKALIKSSGWAKEMVRRVRWYSMSD